MSSIRRKFGILSLFAGTLLLLSAAYQLYQRVHFLLDAEHRQGVVISLDQLAETDTDGNETNYYYPRIRFEASDGESYEFRSSTGSNPASYTLGDEVEIVFSAQDPHQSLIYSFAELWGAILALSLFGSVCIIIPLAVAKSLNHRQRALARKTRFHP